MINAFFYQKIIFFLLTTRIKQKEKFGRNKIWRMANIFKFGGRRKKVNFGGNLIWQIFSKSAKFSSPKGCDSA